MRDSVALRMRGMLAWQEREIVKMEMSMQKVKDKVKSVYDLRKGYGAFGLLEASDQEEKFEDALATHDDYGKLKALKTDVEKMGTEIQLQYHEIQNIGVQQLMIEMNGISGELVSAASNLTKSNKVTYDSPMLQGDLGDWSRTECMNRLRLESTPSESFEHECAFLNC